MGDDRQARLAPGWRGWIQSDRVRRRGLWLFALLAAYALLGFFAVPALVHKPLERSLATALARPVSIGRLTLNPFTLRAQAERIHVGERAGSDAFVDIGRVAVRVSWSSLPRLKPIIREFTLDAPSVHIVRTAPQQFNFSDLLAAPAKPAKPAGASPSLFALYNIRIDGGSVDFDDRVLGQKHRLERLSLGIPFIANLPSKIEVFVEPRLSAVIDGSSFALGGRTKPFSPSRDSELSFQLDHLQLPPLLAYAPVRLPVALSSGWLSMDLRLRFRQEQAAPVVELGGSVDAGDLDLKDGDGLELLQAHAVHLAADSVQPLRGIFHLGELRIEQPALQVQRDAAGVLNFGRLRPAQTPAPAAQSPATAATPAAPAPATTAGPDLVVRHFALNGGSVRYQDFRLGHPATLALQQIGIDLSDLSTSAPAPAHYQVQTSLESGGTLAAQGSLSLKAATLDGTASVQKLELPPLQPFLAGALAARLDAGAVDGQASVALDWSKSPAAVRVAPAHLELHALRLAAGKAGEPILSLDRLAVDIPAVDLAAHQAQVSSVELEGLAVHAQRAADGTINLATLVHAAPATPARSDSKRPAPQQPAPAWHYSVGRVGLHRSALSFVDAAHPQAAVRITSLEVKVRGIGDDLRKPWRVTASGNVNTRGHIAVNGTVAAAPLKLSLHVNAKRIDVAAPVQSYAGAQLNATIASALLSLDGDVGLAQGRAGLAASYKGDAALTRVRLLDNLSSDVFTAWQTLSVAQIDAAYGGDATAVRIGTISVDDFYARIFLDSKGQLNLSNLVRRGNAPVQSLTRVGKTAGAVPLQPAVPVPATPTPPLSLQVGAFNMHGGRVNYTDDFIKPNFSANLTDIVGQVGTIGTQTTTPAPLQIRAQLESNGPIAIDGSLNPLVKPAFLDLSASAHGIALTNFSAYAEKYIGYQIVKGTLTVDLHYKLDHDALTADNHVFIDQFTFGRRVDSPSATSLPVRLAIGLLKDAQGRIDVDLPVSGSLSDPQFSVSGLVWHAIRNLLVKTVTSPFSLLASAFGGSEELGYVTFPPGSSVIAADQGGKLETVRKAMLDRPGVSLDVIGRADPALDRTALQQFKVERQIKAQKYEDLKENGVAADIDSLIVPPGEYQKYLERAYSAAKFPKPKNFIGLDKSLPPEQMRNLLLEHAAANDADLRDLAQQRAAAVQAWFDGKLPPGRIYVVAPALDAAGIKDSGPTTRADFSVH